VKVLARRHLGDPPACRTAAKTKCATPLHRLFPVILPQLLDLRMVQSLAKKRHEGDRLRILPFGHGIWGHRMFIHGTLERDDGGDRNRISYCGSPPCELQVERKDVGYRDRLTCLKEVRYGLFNGSSHDSSEELENC